MQNTRKTGSDFENLACTYLRQQGVAILQKNFRVRQGEIDIIGMQKGILIFFEVKYRKNKKNGLSQEAVGIKKQRQVCKVALFYLAFHNIPVSHPCRFDVIAMNGNEIEWIQNAFSFSQGVSYGK